MQLIENIYHQDGRDGKLGEEPYFEDKTDLIRHRYEHKISAKVMRYETWLVLNIAYYLCYCCKKRLWHMKITERLFNIQELRKRLNLELDIIQLIKSARYSRVLSKI